MQEYHIVLAPSAKEDLENVVAWLSEQAPEKMAEWITSLRADIDTLKTMPERCPYAPENHRPPQRPLSGRMEGVPGPAP